MRQLFVVLLLASAACQAQTGNVTISYGSTGLNSILYNGFQYLSNGNFSVSGINFISSSGQVTAGSTAGTAAYDAVHQKTTITFSWGVVTAAYSTVGNKMNIIITTTNNYVQTVQGLFYEPLDVVFPSAPQEFDGVDPILGINMGNPTALRMTTGSTAMVLANNDVVLPLLVGFPWSYNKPANTVFPIKVETSQDPMLPNSLPFINRPIAPGSSDVYRISLRFGASSATTKSLVTDVYQQFATAYPFTLNWTDRRPLGQLIIANTATGYPTNPRGWFNDPTVDVTTPQGIAAFQARLLSWAQSAVTVLQGMNAQGMVTWDIEGEQYPQPITYIGDPTQYGSLAPEMTGVVKQYFKTFTDAGLRVGVCIRPQQLVIPAGGGTPSQNTVADPTQLLLAKVAYAYNNWGATLFYIDSNGDPNYPMDARFFQAVAAQYPNVLLIPENQTDAYYAFSAPYDELKAGVPATPQSVLDVYPSAFSNIYTPDGPFTQDQALLQAAVKRGDLMMFRGWYADPQNQELLSLYPPNGVAPPPPALATPISGSTVAGTVNLTSTVAPGPSPVDSVQYVLDGVNTGPALTTAPYSYSLAAGSLTAGVHNIQTVAIDAIGDIGVTSANIFMESVRRNPGVLITAPTNEATISGTMLIESQVEDQIPLTGVEFTVDGVSLGTMITAPFQLSWDTTAATNGQHTVEVLATDSAGRTGHSQVIANVQN